MCFTTGFLELCLTSCVYIVLYSAVTKETRIQGFAHDALFAKEIRKIDVADAM